MIAFFFSFRNYDNPQLKVFFIFSIDLTYILLKFFCLAKFTKDENIILIKKSKNTQKIISKDEVLKLI